MEFTNALPIPDFASAIPAPSNQSSSTTTTHSNSASASQQGGVSTRKLKDEPSGIFHPIRRTFSVPVASDDFEVHESVRNALLYKMVHMSKKENKDLQSSIDKEKNELQEAINKEKERLEMEIGALKAQKIETESELERSQKTAHQAQLDLVRVIKERDQEIKKVKENPPQSAMNDQAVLDLMRQKDELCAKVKKLEKDLKEMEEKWAMEDTERSQRLAKELEERKRKAAEQIEEQKRKRQKLQEAEISETKRLEEELKAQEKELEELNQTQSQLIWLMKVVIKAQNQQKALGQADEFKKK